jgi:DNA-binding transcriptional MerR regulator
MVNSAAVVIPEKLFFKIGEVCEIAGVQAHVLRYWESEFPMLAPQKNRAGQRTYRKRDVEMALRIKELLYEEQYTIAGAKKKLQSEIRGTSRLKVVTPDMTPAPQPAPQPPPVRLAPPPVVIESPTAKTGAPQVSGDDRMALRKVASGLIDLLNMLDADDLEA